MAVEIVNVRLQSGTLARIDELRAGTGLSRARAIELAVLVALRSDWSPAGQAPARELTESGLSAHGLPSEIDRAARDVSLHALRKG